MYPRSASLVWADLQFGSWSLYISLSKGRHQGQCSDQQRSIHLNCHPRIHKNLFTCKEYIPDDDTAAAAADMDALSEVDITAEGVPSMDDLLSPPRRLNPDPEAEDPRWADDTAGVRGVVNMRSLTLVTLRCVQTSAKFYNSSTFKSCSCGCGKIRFVLFFIFHSFERNSVYISMNLLWAAEPENRGVSAY